MKNANEPAIDIVNLVLAYRTTPILKGLHLQVRRGEIYALLGGNGAGKSTTINALLGFALPTSGQVRVCGIDVTANLRAVRASLAYVPENVVLYEYLSARENLEYFLSLAGEAAGAGAIEQALESVALDRTAWDRRLSAYSKGMRQKVAIALALAREVPLLLLDEPTSGLDPQATREFNALLQRLRAHGKAVFIVTHDLLSAAEVADRIGFLDGGVLAAEYAARGDGRFDVQELYRRYGAAKEAA